MSVGNLAWPILNTALTVPDIKRRSKMYVDMQRQAHVPGVTAAGGIPDMKKISARRALPQFLKSAATAPVGGWELAKALPGALGLGAGLAAGGMLVAGGAKGVGAVYQRMTANRMFDELKRIYPEIRAKEKDARKYFDMIVAFAPGLMRHHAAIGDFLRRQLEYPMSSVEFIKQLADLQATLAKTTGESLPMSFGRQSAEAAGKFIPGISVHYAQGQTKKGP